MKIISVFIFALFSIVQVIGQTSSFSSEDKSRWLEHVSNIEIFRDTYGVGHVYGKSDADAVFGMLYAQCEDDFRRVERNYLWATGRLSEAYGEKYLYSDLRARLFMTEKEAQEKYKHAPEWLKELCVAFADGINYYLFKHPEAEPKVILKYEPWMPLFFSEGSIGGDIERVSLHKIKDFYGKGQDFIDQSYGYYGPNSDDEPKGSNGIAVTRSMTASGNAILLINPHTSFYFRGEYHVSSNENLDAYGAVTWGQFFIYQGFNDKTGWMHTSTGVDIIDEFAETIVKQNEKLFYRYDEELREVKELKVKINYSDGTTIKQREFTIYRTHHGPVTHMEDGKWISTALMWKPVKALEQSFIRTKQIGHKGFKKMMDMRTNSSNNTVYADADGNIAYYHGNFIPVRDEMYDYTQPVDGANSATDWKGLHTVDENLYLLNPKTDWLQNCNSTPFTAAGYDSPKQENYRSYMATYPERYRGIHAQELLKKAENLTIESMIELAYDPYIPGAFQLAQTIVNAYRHSETLDMTDDENSVIDLLRKWDGQLSESSREMPIIEYFKRSFFNTYRFPSETEGFIGQINHIENSVDEVEIRIHVRKAISDMKSDFGEFGFNWGDMTRFQRWTGEIGHHFDDDKPSVPIGLASGRWGGLASFGTVKNNTKRRYGVNGNSFVAVVEFGDKVKAKSLLAGGQSSDPDSPHFDDQISLYRNFQFKDVNFYKTDVIGKMERMYRP